MDLLKSTAVKSVADDRGPADDVLASSQLLHIPLLHFRFDAVLDGICLGGGLGGKFFSFLHFGDTGLQFIDTHSDKSPFRFQVSSRCYRAPGRGTDSEPWQ